MRSPSRTREYDSSSGKPIDKLKIHKIEDGLWDIDGRGKIDLTSQGVFFVGLNKPGDKWTDEEKRQIDSFVAKLRGT